MSIENKAMAVANFAIENKEDLKEYLNIFLEYNKINAQIDQVSSMNEVRLKNLAEKYQTQRLLIERVFGERAFALKSQYEALHRGLDMNDRTIVVSALQAITDTVCQNPVEKLEEYSRALSSSDDVLELDF